MTIQEQIDGFIDGVRNGIKTSVLNTNLPFVGDDLKDASTSVLAFLDDIKTKIDNAFASVPSTAQGIADAITNAHIDGVTAVVDSSNSDKVILSFARSDSVDVH